MHFARRACAAVVFTLASVLGAQQPDAAAVLRAVDANVLARVEHVLGFTDVEHYAVYRGKDRTHPVAQMTVLDIYKKGVGKSYRILSESGPELVRKFGLHPLLDSEKNINEPGNVARSWFTTANYAMELKPGGVQRMNGRACYALTIVPRHKAPNMVEGTLWVDAKDGAIVQVDGVASRSPSIFAGTTRMMRQYADVDGYPMATHARAESESALFGRTVVTIDYSEYHLKTGTEQ